MLLSDAIKNLQAIAENASPNATFVLFDKSADGGNGRHLVADPDTEEWDFEILIDNDGAVIEFG